MTWGTVKLNDGRHLPEIGYGSWKIGNGQTVIDQVDQAIDNGFVHLDTAQIYRNEKEVGDAIKESGLDRKDLWVTTKWSGMDGKGIRESLNDSLKNLGLKSVDLYLIHSPRLTAGNPPASWQEFEQLKKEGLIKSAGVSNFGILELETLRLAGLSTPAVNQILLHPYVYESTKALLAYHNLRGIVTEAYSVLTPLTNQTGGPLDMPLAALAATYDVTPAMILLAWARQKGAVPITTSRQKKRVQDFIAAGNLHLTEKDIEWIDQAGAQFDSWKRKQKFWRAVPLIALTAGLTCLELYIRR